MEVPLSVALWARTMNDSDNGDSNIYSGLPEFRYDETLDKVSVFLYLCIKIT